VSRERDNPDSREQLLAAKRRLSSAILGLRGVSGLGIQGDELVVYLADGSSEVREHVARVIGEREPTVRWRCEVTGVFRPQ
jgi:hypothetical protein